MLLRASGICKRIGSNTILDNVSFSIREREILGLIGPNGAGKTTLFECLARLLPIDSGRIEPARRQTLFYLPDAIRPWPDQPVAWVLSFFADLQGRSRCEASELAEALHLGHLLKAPVGSLSKGECKRMLLGLGLLTSAPLLLLDEPFDGLDFRQTRDVMALLRSYPARGRTLFLSIHQLTDAARVCDRLVLLSQGRVVGEGTLAELRSRAGLGEGGLEEVFLALT